MSRLLQNLLILGAILGFGSSGPIRLAVAETLSSSLRLRVFVANAAGVRRPCLNKAREIASGIYHSAGVEMVWLGCPADDSERTEYPECRGPFGPRDLFLRILPASNANLIPQEDAFGVALIPQDGSFGRTAYVAFDRVEKWTWDKLRDASTASHVPPGDRSALTLGVVMAHELGHLLLGSHSHSGQGVMRAAWNQQHLEDVYDGRQGFKPEQVARLRTEARLRATRSVIPPL